MSLVVLNIGGQRYTTTAATLHSQGENYFTSLLSGRIPAAKDDTGAYFIDRNGRYFEPILDFLRSGTLALPLSHPWQSIKLEAEFYLIKSMLRFFSSDAESKEGSKASLGAVSVPDAPEPEEPMDISNITATSLQERVVARHTHTAEAFAAITSCLRAVHRAAQEGAVGLTIVIGEPEGATISRGNFRRYQRPRFIEHLQVASSRELEAMLTCEGGRETLYVMLRQRGFAVRFLSVPCMMSAAISSQGDGSFHDGMLVYWGSVPVDELLTATRKDIFSL